MSDRDDIETRGNDLEGRLFALARTDQPSADARRRALVALGVGASVATAAVATEAAAVVKVAALTGASAATGHAANTVVAATILKWVALGAVAGTVAVGGTVGIERLTSSHADATSQPSPRVGQEQAASRAPRTSTPAPSVEPYVPPSPPSPEPANGANGDRDALRQVPVARTSANAGAASAPVPLAPEVIPPQGEAVSSLEEEVTSIDRARSALATGAPARALVELDDYDARFPAGMMKPEATVVRIEAMVQNGNLAGAKARGRQFLSVHPNGGLSVRVHKVIGE